MVIESHLEQMEDPLQLHTEEELIDQSKKDPRAFKVLYELYFKAIFKFHWMWLLIPKYYLIMSQKSLWNLIP